MPGLHLIIGGEEEGDNRDKFERFCPHLLHLPDYESEILINRNRILLATTKYPEYPAQFYETDKFDIYLEGYIYNKARGVVKRELIELARKIDGVKGDKVRIVKSVKDWVFQADGSFISVIFNKDEGNILQFNDSLGRLPLYYHLSDGCFIASRELKLVAHFMPEPELNKTSFAEYLSFGCSLQEHTLVKGVSRLPYSSVVYGENIEDEHRFVIERYWDVNMDRRNHNLVYNRETAQNVYELFKESCINIKDTFSPNNIVLSLTGGIDSRAVAMSMKEIGADLSTVCFMDIQGYFQDDIEVSKRVADVLNIPWTRYDLSKNSYDDIRGILKEKDGSVTVNHGPLRHFNRYVREKYEPDMVMLTGDAGGTYLSSFLPPSRPDGIEKTAGYIMERFQAISPDIVENLLDLPEDFMLNHICEIISNYKEEDPLNMIARFRVIDVEHQLSYESEDRSRIYYWLETPFDSAPLFRYLVSIPESYRVNRLLFKHFMDCMDPHRRVMNIVYANWKRRLHTPLAPVIFQLNRFRRLKELYLKPLFGVRRYPANIVDEEILKEIEDKISDNDRGILNSRESVSFLNTTENQYNFAFLSTLILFQDYLFNTL